MNPITKEIQIALGAIILVLILLLGFGTYHYHNAWVEGKEDLAKLTVSTAQLKEASNTCNKAVEDLKASYESKNNDIKKAQAQAAVLARNNETLAQTLLSANPDSKDSCAAAVKLYKEYKSGQN